MEYFNSLEDFVAALAQDGKKRFRNINVVKALGLVDILDQNRYVVVSAGKQASRLLDAYQARQNEGGVDYLIHRIAGSRAGNSIWQIGHRQADAQDIYYQFSSDMVRRFERSIDKILAVVSGRNPQARAKVAKAKAAIVDALNELAEAGI